MISRPDLLLSGGARKFRTVRWDPWAEIAIDVIEGPIRHVRGAYVPDAEVIVLRSGLTDAEARSALAHELAHHELGHWPHPDEGENDRMEQRAARWAAVRLVSIGDLMEALRSSDDIFDIAEDLGVDPELLEVRLRWLSDDERRELGCDD